LGLKVTYYTVHIPEVSNLPEILLGMLKISIGAALYKYNFVMLKISISAALYKYNFEMLKISISAAL